VGVERDASIVLGVKKIKSSRRGLRVFVTCRGRVVGRWPVKAPMMVDSEVRVYVRLR
jgi:hypothetical protein